MGSFDAAYVCRETGDFISRYRMQNPRTLTANESHQDFKPAVDGRIFRFLSFSEKILEPQMGQRDSLSVADSSFQRLTLEVLRSTPRGMPQPCLFSVGEVPRKVI